MTKNKGDFDNDTGQDRTGQDRTGQDRTGQLLRIIKRILHKLYFPVYIHFILDEWYVRKHFEKIVTKNYSNIRTEEAEKIIWTMWWQGEAEMPDVVKNAIASQKMEAQKLGFKHTILTQDNIEKYLKLDKNIVITALSKKITMAMFSDYIRSRLMSEYGGIWMDATLFVHKSIDPQIISYDFFNPKGLIEPTPLKGGKYYQSFFLAARKGSHLYTAISEILESYILSSNHSRSNYLAYLIYNVLIASNQEFIENSLKIPENNRNTLYFYFPKKFKRYSNEAVLAGDTNIYKLSWKFQFETHDENGELTVYGLLLESKGLLNEGKI